MKKKLHIPLPCPADWASMEGDQQKRFCESCHLHVTDLSEMTDQEIHSLFAQEKEGERLCVRARLSKQGEVISKTTRHQAFLGLLQQLAQRKQGGASDVSHKKTSH
ncbi:MAG: hypothetical protein H6728_14180 [Myxococcales bacterium]|nr:hypothetical protein [Myxococcales bacterium]